LGSFAASRPTRDVIFRAGGRRKLHRRRLRDRVISWVGHQPRAIAITAYKLTFTAL